MYYIAEEKIWCVKDEITPIYEINEDDNSENLEIVASLKTKR